MVRAGSRDASVPRSLGGPAGALPSVADSAGDPRARPARSRGRSARARRRSARARRRSARARRRGTPPVGLVRRPAGRAVPHVGQQLPLHQDRGRDAPAAEPRAAARARRLRDPAPRRGRHADAAAARRPHPRPPCRPGCRQHRDPVLADRLGRAAHRLRPRRDPPVDRALLHSRHRRDVRPRRAGSPGGGWPASGSASSASWSFLSRTWPTWAAPSARSGCWRSSPSSAPRWPTRSATPTRGAPSGTPARSCSRRARSGGRLCWWRSSPSSSMAA